MYIPKVEEKHYFCFKCANELDFERVKMQRTDQCIHCGADMHCCRNCEYWEPGSHNQCREHIAEYISDRERMNHCTHFTYRNGAPEATDADKAKDRLKSLFK